MRTTALVVLLTILSGGTADVFAGQRQPTALEATAWKDVAAAIPLGSRVKAQTVNGDRLTGTLMRVGNGEVLVKKNTRRPEPAVAIAFADLTRLERDHGNGGINVAKAIGIGLAAGAGVLLTLFVIALQLD